MPRRCSGAGKGKPRGSPATTGRLVVTRCSARTVACARDNTGFIIEILGGRPAIVSSTRRAARRAGQTLTALRPPPTVTCFARKRHVTVPGASCAGNDCRDSAFPARALSDPARTYETSPGCGRESSCEDLRQQIYAGHTLCVSGALRTGAARLAARGALAWGRPRQRRYPLAPTS